MFTLWQVWPSKSNNFCSFKADSVDESEDPLEREGFNDRMCDTEWKKVENRAFQYSATEWVQNGKVI